MKSLPKRILFGVIFFLLIATPAHALVSVNSNSFQKAVSTTDKYNKESFDLQSFSGLLNSVNIGLLGCQREPLIPGGQQPDCPPDLKTGAINTASVMVASLYTHPPASGVAYFAETLNDLGLASPAYAQVGTGFQGLTPLLPLWRTFRNFAYIVFIIVFVAVGLAIMFRFKLNPQTVVTIQSAIPRIIVALLLVTFSYAIVGLLIDLLYVLIGLTVLLFKGSGGDVARVQSEFLTGGFGGLWNNLWGVVGGDLNLKIFFGSIATLVAASLVPGPIGAGIAALGLGGIIFLTILLLIILYLLIKIFIELLKAYIFILFALIFGPIQIALGVIPGFPGFGAWFKTLLANILIFPAVAFVVLFGQAITASGIAQNLWAPPLLAGEGLLSAAFPALLGIGVLLVVHQVPQAIKDAFGIKGLGFNAGQPLAIVTGPASTYMEAEAKGATNVTGRFLWGAGAKALGGIGGGRR